MKARSLVILATAALAAVPAAFAQQPAPLVAERTLSASLALEAAEAAIAACRAQGYGISVAIVDRSGNLRLAVRGDNTYPHTMDAARAKAYTAVTLGGPQGVETTTDVAQRFAQNPAAAPLGALPGITLLGGGVVVRVDKQVVAGIGAGGAPGGHLDEACVKAGIDKVRDRIGA